MTDKMRVFNTAQAELIEALAQGQKELEEKKAKTHIDIVVHGRAIRDNIYFDVYGKMRD